VAQLAQAVMEGVAFAFRDCQRVLNDAGTTFSRLLAVGGGSKSELWLRLIASNLNTEIALPADGDFGGALGVARLGLCAAEGVAPEQIMTMPAIKRVIRQSPSWSPNIPNTTGATAPFIRPSRRPAHDRLFQGLEPGSL